MNDQPPSGVNPDRVILFSSPEEAPRLLDGLPITGEVTDLTPITAKDLVTGEYPDHTTTTAVQEEQAVTVHNPLIQPKEKLPLRVQGKNRWYTVKSLDINGVVLEGDTSGILDGEFGFSWKGYSWAVEENHEDEGWMLAKPFMRTWGKDRHLLKKKSSRRKGIRRHLRPVR